MNHHRSISIFTICLVFFAAGALALAAGYPTSISYQGTMVDKTGVPVTGGKSIKFSLYSTTGGATSLWSETQAVTVTNGQFSAQLGSASQLDAAKFKGKTYLGLTIGNDPEMSPRQQMVSVPYAMNGVPAGSVIAFAGTVEPPGWLLCDGRSLKRSDYPDLFSTIGTAYGATDSSHFNLPDNRGRFLRGVDYSPNVNPVSTGNDPDSNNRRAMWDSNSVVGPVVGSVQGDIMRSHTHYSPSGDGGQVNASNGPNAVYGGNSTTRVTGATGGSETRPINIYVNWIIKY
jgi:microcystin-dependent protein